MLQSGFEVASVSDAIRPPVLFLHIDLYDRDCTRRKGRPSHTTIERSVRLSRRSISSARTKRGWVAATSGSGKVSGRAFLSDLKLWDVWCRQSRVWAAALLQNSFILPAGPTCIFPFISISA
jgi:hypothetical protein